MTACSRTNPAPAVDTIGGVEPLASRYRVTLTATRDSIQFDPRGLSMDGVTTTVQIAGAIAGGYDSLDVTKVGQLGNSEVGSVDHGVLKLTLLPGSYQWEFIPVGYTLPVDATPPQYSHTDSGSGSCH